MSVDDGLIRVKREGAERSRRLAMMLTLEADRVRLLAYADELDAQADALEEAARESTSLPPGTVAEDRGNPGLGSAGGDVADGKKE